MLFKLSFVKIIYEINKLYYLQVFDIIKCRCIMISSINNNSDKKNDIRLKVGVTAVSALTTGAALAHIAKRQGFSLSPSVIRKTPVKDWAVFKLQNKEGTKKVLDLEWEEILELGAASVAGGLAAGLLLDDKKHRKSKLRESVNQFIGNITVPVACVTLVSKLYKKHENAILSKVPQLKETGKFTHYVNKALKGIPFSITTIAALGTGILAGNRVSNLLNEKVFHKKVDRKIKGTDFAPHVDDLGVALTLMGSKGKISSIIQRLVPAFLCVPGYQTGVHKD